MNNMQHIPTFLTGVFLHILIFSRDEWDRHTPMIVSMFSLLFTVVFIITLPGTNYSFTQSVMETCKLGLALSSGVFGSMTIYRYMLHPLGSFPGPIAARISSFWIFRESWPNLRFYVTLRKLHDDHGDFVRISKNIRH